MGAAALKRQVDRLFPRPGALRLGATRLGFTRRGLARLGFAGLGSARHQCDPLQASIGLVGKGVISL